MTPHSSGMTALVLAYIASIISHTYSDRTDIDEYPYDNPDTYEAQAEEASFISLADLLESKRTALEFQELLNSISKQRRQKKNRCNIGTGGTSCNAESYEKARDHLERLLSSGMPGRRRRRETYEESSTN